MNFFSNYSGGFIYHARAATAALKRFAGRDPWEFFRVGVAHWLQAWDSDCPRFDDLILVGPSAGYSLENVWLNKFSRVWIVEPDPVARLIFSKRFPEIRKKLNYPNFRSVDWQSIGKAENNFFRFISGLPRARILFTNLLGQLRYFIKDPEINTPKNLKTLSDALADRNWATYHDALSCEMEPSRKIWLKGGRLSPTEILEKFYPKEKTAFSELEFNDHLTLGQDWGKSANGFRYFHWPLTKKQHHIIEAFYCSVKLPVR